MLVNASERLIVALDVPTVDDAKNLIAQLDGLRKHGVLSEEEFQQKKAQLLAKL